MNFLKLALASALVLTTVQVSAKTDGTRGGGNAIRCDDGKLYAWDFINAKLDNVQIDTEFQKAPTAKEILEKISTRLPQISLQLAFTLDDFRKFNSDLFSKDSNRIWIKGHNPLIAVGDEDRTRIPKSCVANAGADFKLYQAVIRTQNGAGGKIRYEYDPDLIAELERTNPLQLSFLYVHEWLRDFLDDSNSITIANQFIHSPQLATNDQGHSHQIFKELGMSFHLRLPFGKYRLASGKAFSAPPEVSYGLASDGKSYVYKIRLPLHSKIEILDVHDSHEGFATNSVFPGAKDGWIEIKKERETSYGTTSFSVGSAITSTLNVGINKSHRVTGSVYVNGHVEADGETCLDFLLSWLIPQGISYENYNGYSNKPLFCRK